MEPGGTKRQTETLNNNTPFQFMAEESLDHHQLRCQSSSAADEQSQTWGTWEELLLAFAVKRHGFASWESVAAELQTKTSLPQVLATAERCRQKYQDLNRRFSVAGELVSNGSVEKAVHIPWIEELRKLRVAELKQEVQRYDVSILSLQLKVKKLEDEREHGLQEKDGGKRSKPDLPAERHRSEADAKVSVSMSSRESDRDNRSVNESNSTASGAKKAADGVKLEDPKTSGSNSKREEEEETESVSQRSGEIESSSASLRQRRKRQGRKRRRNDVDGGGSKAVEEVGNGVGVGGQSEPLIGLMDMIRAHEHGSLFERRLQSQETDAYSSTVKQHLDLETIQSKLLRDELSYPSSLSFYRDLLLIFTNAIVFFPKSSAQSLAAKQLRSIVVREMKKEPVTLKSDSSQPTDSIPPPQQPKVAEPEKLPAPLVVCRRRSSMSAKPSSSTSVQKVEQPVVAVTPQPKESTDREVEQGSPPIAKPEKKAVTGARSSRRSNKKNVTKTIPSNKRQNGSPGNKATTTAAEKLETPKKKTEASGAEKKRSAAADFLKRIKKNSPGNALSKKSSTAGNSPGDALSKKKSGGSGNGGGGGSSRGAGEKKKKNDEKGKGRGKQRLLRSNDEKKPSAAKEVNKPTAGGEGSGKNGSSTSGNKRGRPETGSGVKETAAQKKPRKRARR